MKKTTETAPGKKLYNEICGSLRIHGESLEILCQKFTHQGQPIKRQNARLYLLGQRNGPIAKEWRERIIKAVYSMGFK